MAYLRAIFFYLGIYSFLFFIVVTSPLLIFLPYRWRYYHLTRWGRFSIWWLKVTCNLTYKVEGLENIPDSPTIVLAKHQSAWETIALQEILPRQTWVLKRELLWLPIFGWGLALMYPVAIDRKAGKKALKQVIEQGTRRLKMGLWLIIFPEGTRTAPGERKRYAIGGAMLAQKSGFPVLPVCHNAGEFWPKNNLLKKPGTISLVIGEPISPSNMRANEINEQVEEWIEKTYQRITTLQ
ncbi:MAG: lysophospholipid acyltransferase family protein [Pseudomonadota bacterium]